MALILNNPQMLFKMLLNKEFKLFHHFSHLFLIPSFLFLQLWFNGPPHMANQKQEDQLELTYSSYVRTQDVTLNTCRRRWMIGRSGERGSGISVLAARHDDDDDDYSKTSNTTWIQIIQSHGIKYQNIFGMTRKQYQNRKRILKNGHFSPLCTTILLRILSLSLSLSPFLAPFPPRHHIIVNVFLETWYAETPFSSTFLPPCVSSLKLFPLSYN